MIFGLDEVPENNIFKIFLKKRTDQPSWSQLAESEGAAAVGFFSRLNCIRIATVLDSLENPLGWSTTNQGLGEEGASEFLLVSIFVMSDIFLKVMPLFIKTDEKRKTEKELKFPVGWKSENYINIKMYGERFTKIVFILKL